MGTVSSGDIESLGRPDCSFKALYRHRKQAAAAARNLRHKLFDRTLILHPIQAYRCDVHHGWHVGHKTGWRHEVGLPRSEVRTSL